MINLRQVRRGVIEDCLESRNAEEYFSVLYDVVTRLQEELFQTEDETAWWDEQYNALLERAEKDFDFGDDEDEDETEDY